MVTVLDVMGMVQTIVSIVLITQVVTGIMTVFVIQDGADLNVKSTHLPLTIQM